ncbi:major capsid protein [Mycobacterium dioxanotrophicus]|uniref:major capsid protein n=1 Tax=Mycobacterium dioxanotrophicus TaxID=482462 RepID=UPI0012F7F44D|nr:major capsid protein [Mycobacterium dioxanotrophicus]
MKFTTLPDQLPATVTELEELAAAVAAEINVFQARYAAGDEFTEDEVARFEYVTEAHEKVTTERDTLAAAEQTQADKVKGLIERSTSATKKATDPAPAADADAESGTEAEVPAADADTAAAEVVAEAEAATAEAAESSAAVTAGAGVSFGGAVRNSDIPADAPAGEKPKRWTPLASMPKFAEFGGANVSSREIAEAIDSVQAGQRTGRQPTGETTLGGQAFATQALAKMARPQGKVIENAQDLWAELDLIVDEIPGRGKVSAEALVAAGGWCAPSEQLYDFCPTPAAANLLSLPEIAIKRGGIRFPAEPDFTALQTGFHYTEPQLEATDGNGNPTAVKEFVEIPCPDDMIEYRLEAIGWAVKAGILQRQAWPELIEKFVDEFLVAHQYRVSAKTVQKMLGESSAAKVVPTDAVLGATTGVLNGLHVRARNIQLKTRRDTIEGVAPVWFRDVLRADLAMRDGKDMLSVSDAEIDNWLAVRGIYLQYEGTWQSLGTGQPGHLDTSWWPGSVDVILYPAGTFFRSLDNVITLGVQYPIEQVQLNRYTHGFLEDSFLVGKRCGPSDLIRVPLCTNGAVGARETIVCQSATVTKTVAVPGTPTGGGMTLKFSANNIPSGSIAFNSSAANADTALTAIDDGVTQAGDITVAGGPLPGAPLVVTYPAKLGDLQLAVNSLTGGTQPGAGVNIS